VSGEAGEPGPGRAAAARAGPDRAGLAMAGLLLVVGAFLLVQTASLNVPANASVLGPKFFPTVVGILLVAIGAVFAFQAARGIRAEPEADEDVDPDAPPDRRALALVGVALAVHVAGLLLLGYIVAAAALFWVAAFALGSRRHLLSAGIAVVLAVVLYVAFTRGLGLTLPRGPLELVLS
jgi:putative tricarboxylic transport membrane protein